MKALLLSYLYLYIDKENSEVGAGDLATSSLNNGFSELTHNIMSAILNELTKGSLPGHVLDIPPLFVFPNTQNYKNDLVNNEDIKSLNIIRFVRNMVPGMPTEALRNYIFLWRSFIKYGNDNVTIYCTKGKNINCNDFRGFHLAVASNPGNTQKYLNKLKKNSTNGYLIQGTIRSNPCSINKTIEHFKIGYMCTFLKQFSKQLVPFLQLMKYSIQSPGYLVAEKEHLSLFENANETFVKYGFMTKLNKPGDLLGQPGNQDVWSRVRPNAFVPLCSFQKDLGFSNLEDCNFVSRSYTNLGLGYTINSERSNNLFKVNNFNFVTQNTVFFVNNILSPRKMISAGSDHSLRVMIERNSEEVDYFEKTETLESKPKIQKVVLHDPKGPANMISNSFDVPLGHSTVVYIRPNAQKVDESVENLSEAQRGCRLNTQTNSLNVFDIYTKEACQLECDIQFAFEKCGCFPWNYPIIKGSSYFIYSVFYISYTGW